MQTRGRTPEDVLKLLPPRFFVLAGAGISYPPPSNLPTARSIMDDILSALPIPREDRSELLASTSSDWPNGLGYFDCLRFEQVMEALEWSIDDSGALLHSMFPPSRPNRYHHQLARLLQAGHLVMTTNFDCLIELACDALGIPYSVLVLDSDYERYLTNPGEFPHPIFKIHGSMAKNPSSGSGTAIAATVTSVITQQNHNPNKWRVVDGVLTDNTLLVLGYSGYDDFDVLPAIRFARGQQRLIWINHSNSPDIRIWQASETKYSDSIQVDNRLHWYFGRMFGSHLNIGRVKRRQDDVYLVDGPTQSVLDALVPDAFTIPATEDAADTAARHHDALRRAIHDLITGDATQVKLFAGRLLQCVGLYSQALVHLDSALEQARAGGDGRLSGRIHAALARVWMDREERYQAHLRMADARALFPQADELHVRDIDDYIEFAVHLGLDTIDIQSPAFLPALSRPELTEYESRMERLVSSSGRRQFVPSPSPRRSPRSAAASRCGPLTVGSPRAGAGGAGDSVGREVSRAP